jgi:hypothetical protein
LEDPGVPARSAEAEGDAASPWVRPGMTIATSALALITMRRVILIATVLGIPLLWTLAPFGRTVDVMGTGEPSTFAATAIRLAQEASRGDIRDLVPILPILFLGLLSPLYPALVGMSPLAVPRWLATRRRWVWIVERIVGLSLSPVGLAVALLRSVGPCPWRFRPCALLAPVAADGLCGAWRYCGNNNRHRPARQDSSDCSGAVATPMISDFEI